MFSQVEKERGERKRKAEELSNFVKAYEIIKKNVTKTPPDILLGPIKKLLKLVEFHAGYHELIDKGHSPVAAFLGEGAAIAAYDMALGGGAACVEVGLSTIPMQPALGACLATAGVELFKKKEDIYKGVRQSLPIIIDTTLDKFANLYASTTQFVYEAYQKWAEIPDKQQKFNDIESVMLALGYERYVENFYNHLDQRQQLLYGIITRELFVEQFGLNSDGSVKINHLLNDKLQPKQVNVSDLKADLKQIQDKLSTEVKNVEENKDGSINKTIKDLNKQVEQKLSSLVNQANQKARSINHNSNTSTNQNIIKDAYKFCEILNVTSQGISLAARVAGNSKLANQIIHSTIGISQTIMGIAQIAQNGLAMGPVGMVFGGINCLINCFGQNGGDGFNALAQQLEMISKQIHALHEDMLFQFSKVFTALGIINNNMIQGFILLHKDNKTIFKQLQKLHQSLAVLQSNMNFIGHELQAIRGDLHGYKIEDDRKQFQRTLNFVREKIKRLFQPEELQFEIMGDFKTYNIDIIKTALDAALPTSKEIARCFSTELGSAEANIDLLLRYSKHSLNLTIQQPLADPRLWQECVDVLIQMRSVAEKNDKQLLSEPDYEDFNALKLIGSNWLYLINQFKKERQGNPLRLLFKQYHQNVEALIDLLNKEIEPFIKEQITQSAPEFKGYEELKEQDTFQFELKRNGAYAPVARDGSAISGDFYAKEWDDHVLVRLKEIKEKLKSYAKEIEIQKVNYKNITIPLFEPLSKTKTSTETASSFMLSDTKNMPLLPLPIDIKFPSLLAQAEILNLGKIEHRYSFANDVFVCTSRFCWHDVHNQPTLIGQYSENHTIPDHLNSAEANWHLYMGGTYPADGSKIRDYRRLRCDTLICCNLPSLKSFEGLRNTLKINTLKNKKDISSQDLEEVLSRINLAIKNWRLEFNKMMLLKLENADTRNPIAKALLEVDASAKLLIAFISILCRESYEKPHEIWSAIEILNFCQNYQGNDAYLMHQLETNLEVLDITADNLFNELSKHSQIAYTPVNETLKKLNDFLIKHENIIKSKPQENDIFKNAVAKLIENENFTFDFSRPQFTELCIRFTGEDQMIATAEQARSLLVDVIKKFQQHLEKFGLKQKCNLRPSWKANELKIISNDFQVINLIGELLKDAGANFWEPAKLTTSTIFYKNTNQTQSNGLNKQTPLTEETELEHISCAIQ